MAGHLHHHGVDALFDHHRQQRLQIGRLGCGQRAGLVASVDADADSADQPGHPLRRPQAGLDQIGGGGLARRAGDPDDPQVLRRMAVDGGGQLAEHRTRVGMDQHGHRRHRRPCAATPVRVGEHRDGAPRHGVSGVAAAVRRRARQRGEQVARLRVLAAQRHPGDPDVRRPSTPPAGTARTCSASGPSAWPTGCVGRRFMAMTQYRPGWRPPSRAQVACSVSGGPGSGDSGTFSRCSSQAAMLWNSGAIVVPGWPSAVRCGLSAMMPMT